MVRNHVVMLSRYRYITLELSNAKKRGYYICASYEYGYIFNSTVTQVLPGNTLAFGNLAKLDANVHCKNLVNSANSRKSLLSFCPLMLLCQYAFAAAVLSQTSLDVNSSP